jgi:hypothetical protein
MWQRDCASCFSQDPMELPEPKRSALKYDGAAPFDHGTVHTPLQVRRDCGYSQHIGCPSRLGRTLHTARGEPLRRVDAARATLGKARPGTKSTQSTRSADVVEQRCVLTSRAARSNARPCVRVVVAHSVQHGSMRDTRCGTIAAGARARPWTQDCVIQVRQKRKQAHSRNNRTRSVSTIEYDGRHRAARARWSTRCAGPSSSSATASADATGAPNTLHQALSSCAPQ